MVKEKLIEMRKAKGFSIEEIAEKMCKSASSYYRREKGQTKIHLDEWKKLTKILNVPLEDIYEPEDSNPLCLMTVLPQREIILGQTIFIPSLNLYLKRSTNIYKN